MLLVHVAISGSACLGMLVQSLTSAFKRSLGWGLPVTLFYSTNMNSRSEVAPQKPSVAKLLNELMATYSKWAQHLLQCYMGLKVYLQI